jgi:hypothetical protein
LTDFNIKATDFVPTITIATAEDLARVNAQNIHDNPTPAIACLVVITVFVIMAPWLHHRETTVYRKLAPMTEKQIREDRERENEEFRKMNWKQKIKTKVLTSLHYKHAWLGVAFREKHATSTGIERLTCLICTVFGSMATSAFFYGNEQKSSYGTIGVSIVCGLVMLPIRIVFMFIFKKSLTKRQAELKEKHRAEASAKKVGVKYTAGGEEAAEVDNNMWAERVSQQPLPPPPALPDAPAPPGPGVKYAFADPLVHQLYVDMMQEVSYSETEESHSSPQTEESHSSPPVLMLESRSNQDSAEARIGFDGKKAPPSQPHEGDIETGNTQDIHEVEKRDADAKDPEAEEGKDDHKGGKEKRRRVKQKGKKKKPFRLPYRCRTFGYFLAFCWVGACCYCIILYGLMFDMVDTPLTEAAAADGECVPSLRI